MLAQQDTDIRKAVTAVHKLTQEEEFRMKCWAREDHIRQQIDHDAWYDAEIKKREDVIAEKDSALAESYARIEELEKQLAALQNQNK